MPSIPDVAIGIVSGIAAGVVIREFQLRRRRAMDDRKADRDWFEDVAKQARFALSCGGSTVRKRNELRSVAKDLKLLAGSAPEGVDDEVVEAIERTAWRCDVLERYLTYSSATQDHYEELPREEFREEYPHHYERNEDWMKFQERIRFHGSDFGPEYTFLGNPYKEAALQKELMDQARELFEMVSGREIDVDRIPKDEPVERLVSDG